MQRVAIGWLVWRLTKSAYYLGMADFHQFRLLVRGGAFRRRVS